jgi:PLD-like domain
MESYFENIKERILNEFDRAEFVIYAAVAWVTDFDIIKELSKLSQKGIQVELIINKDEKFSKRELQFDNFIKSGGRLFLYPNDNDSIMHNKFCVIDLSTSITGSFNWSFAAETKNKENIIIARDNSQLAKNFALEFKKLKQSSVIFETQKVNNLDLSHYVTISATQRRSRHESINYRRILLTLKEGKKMCYLEIETNDIKFIEGFNPPKAVLGYWKNKSEYYNIDTKELQYVEFEDSTLFDFECTDSQFFKTISENINGEYQIAIM